MIAIEGRNGCYEGSRQGHFFGFALFPLPISALAAR
jgi:hypothetical protein